ncbi:hypothetical protein NKG94_19960 [Micromonospora sp. M12]
MRHWADGGDTSLDNAVLLCGHHHRHVHHGDWVVQLGGDGQPEFIPPAWLDPEQVPAATTTTGATRRVPCPRSSRRGVQAAVRQGGSSSGYRCCICTNVQRGRRRLGPATRRPRA